MKLNVSPMQQALIALILLGSAVQSNAQSNPSVLSSLAKQNQSDTHVLTLEQAFPFHVSEVAPGHFRVSWNIAEGHYLYRRAFKISLQDATLGKVSPVEYSIPAGIEKFDEFFGDVEVYFLEVGIDLMLEPRPTEQSSLVIEFQGCAEWGFCYPPQKSIFKIK